MMCCLNTLLLSKMKKTMKNDDATEFKFYFWLVIQLKPTNYACCFNWEISIYPVFRFKNQYTHISSVIKNEHLSSMQVPFLAAFSYKTYYMQRRSCLLKCVISLGRPGAKRSRTPNHFKCIGRCQSFLSFFCHIIIKALAWYDACLYCAYFPVWISSSASSYKVGR